VSELSAHPGLEESSEPVNELFQDPPPIVARGLLYVLLAMLLAGGVYSVVGQIDELVTGTGTVVPHGLSRPIQSTAAGRVSRVAVQEGEDVDREQVLVYLETDVVQAGHERARKELLIRQRQLQSVLAAQTGALEVSEARARLAQAEEAEVAARRALEASMIVAPLRGRLTRLAVRGAGEAVEAGQVVGEIAPHGAPLVFEARIPNAGIGRVRMGQRAHVKVHAFPHQEYGTLEGTVTFIAPDATQEPGAAGAYRVMVTPLPRRAAGAVKDIPLRPGLAATVEIVAGRKRLAELLVRSLRGGV
jgi:multidrug efflux pump subunit AcrA (membrane-fusion protein)